MWYAALEASHPFLESSLAVGRAPLVELGRRWKAGEAVESGGGGLGGLMYRIGNAVIACRTADPSVCIQ